MSASEAGPQPLSSTGAPARPTPTRLALKKNPVVSVELVPATVHGGVGVTVTEPAGEDVVALTAAQTRAAKRKAKKKNKALKKEQLLQQQQQAEQQQQQQQQQLQKTEDQQAAEQKEQAEGSVVEQPQHSALPAPVPTQAPPPHPTAPVVTLVRAVPVVTVSNTAGTGRTVMLSPPTSDLRPRADPAGTVNAKGERPLHYHRALSRVSLLCSMGGLCCGAMSGWSVILS